MSHPGEARAAPDRNEHPGQGVIVQYSLALASFIFFAFAMAGTVKGVLGMGLPTVAMALLSLAMPPAHAAALLVVPSLVTNLWQLAAGPAMGRVIRRFGWMMAAICAGTFLGIALLADASTIAKGVLGAVLVLYGISGLLSIRFQVRRESERWMSPVMGFITGVLTGATGIFVIPAVPYYASLEMDRETLIQTLGLAFTVSTIALAVGLAYTGYFHLSAGAASLLSVLPAAAGMYLGQRIRMRLQGETFRLVFFGALIPLGIYMVVNAVLH